MHRPTLLIIILAAAIGPLLNAQEEKKKPTIPAKKPVRLEVEIDHAMTTEGEIHAPIKLCFINDTDTEITVFPYVEVELTDAAGKLVKPAQRLSMSGRIRSTCKLSGLTFLKIPAQSKISISASLKRFTWSKHRILSWKLKNAGDYTMRIRWLQDRRTNLKACSATCECLTDRSVPWRRLQTYDQTVTKKFKVRTAVKK